MGTEWDAGTEWEAKEILWAMDRMPRSLWDYQDLARVHVSLSGTLLETLANPEFQSRVYGIVDCGSLLWYLQNQRIFDILGTGYYHPVLPLIPETDREEQVARWLGIARHLFARQDFSGFWPPEMGFSMELIPLLKRMGYCYVLVDSKHVEPVDAMAWHELRYRPHIARHQGEEIVVVVRDRNLSDAQEAGMDYGWFYHELHERTKHCDFPPLVTTCSDGDNGGWFRNTHPKGNFWGTFYQQYMHEIRMGWSTARPIYLHDYLDHFGAHGEVRVSTGAWNTGWHHGVGFVQWTGSQMQKDGLRRIEQTSAEVQRLRQKLAKSKAAPAAAAQALEEAQWRVLRAETSCNFYWGEAWVSRAHGDLDQAAAHLGRAAEILP